jgi:pyruvate dehydrogenase E2 component (dihydrolipoamide acetyltransferase)
MSDVLSATDVTMPELSEGMESGTIIAWLVEDGQPVAVGDELLEVETDKAAMTVAAEAAGVLQIVAAVNAVAAVGEVIARIGGVAAAAAAAPEPAVVPAASEPVLPAAPVTSAPTSNGAASSAVRATPVARRMARQHGVDLSAVRGTGPGGGVVRTDVEQAAGLEPARPPAAATPPPPAAPRPQPQPAAPQGGTAKGAVRVEEPTRVQAVVARRMAESKATAPEFVLGVDVDMEATIALRDQLKAIAGDGKPPSYNDFVVKASALALRAFPRANGAYVGGRFELYENVNVGIAVAADDALVVPTIFDADRKALGAIARDARRLAGRVRDGSITPPELAGGTFTVSNLGMFGISEFSSILNPPQAAILSAGEMKRTPVESDGAIALRHVMKLRLTCDHRILYGADAAGFLQRIKQLLEQPLAMSL